MSAVIEAFIEQPDLDARASVGTCPPELVPPQRSDATTPGGQPVVVGARLDDIDTMFAVIQIVAGPGGAEDALVGHGDHVEARVASSGDPAAPLITRDEIQAMGLARLDSGALSVPACAVVLLLIRSRCSSPALLSRH